MLHLAECGCRTLEILLEMGGQPAGRKQLIVGTGIRDKLILKWTNRADLARIKGVGGQYADLLEASGVDTAPLLTGWIRRMAWSAPFSTEPTRLGILEH